MFELDTHKMTEIVCAPNEGAAALEVKLFPFCKKLHLQVQSNLSPRLRGSFWAIRRFWHSESLEKQAHLAACQSLLRSGYRGAGLAFRSRCLRM